jgi:mannose-6-phosphate isomerase-like protein (cupin superfamily)
MTPTAPGLVAAKSMRERVETADGGFRLTIVTDADSHGSKLWFGVGRLRPGTELVSWTADDETHEVYYVSLGTLKVGWTGHNRGEALVGASEAFWFPPGHRYTLENGGHGEAVFVWAVTPAPGVARW